MMEDQDLRVLFQEVFGVDPNLLRDDQKRALQVLSNEAKDIIESSEKVLFCTLRIKEPDLLLDRPVYIAYNIKRAVLKKIITHTYNRIVLQDRLIADDFEIETVNSP